MIICNCTYFCANYLYKQFLTGTDRNLEISDGRGLLLLPSINSSKGILHIPNTTEALILLDEIGHYSEFSDFLLCCQMLKNDEYELCKKLLLKLNANIGTPEPNNLDLYTSVCLKYLFMILHELGHDYFYIEGEEDRKIWFSKINDAIDYINTQDFENTDYSAYENRYHSEMPQMENPDYEGEVKKQLSEIKSFSDYFSKDQKRKKEEMAADLFSMWMLRGCLQEMDWLKTEKQFMAYCKYVLNGLCLSTNISILQRKMDEYEIAPSLTKNGKFNIARAMVALYNLAAISGEDFEFDELYYNNILFDGIMNGARYMEKLICEENMEYLNNTVNGSLNYYDEEKFSSCKQGIDDYVMNLRKTYFCFDND